MGFSSFLALLYYLKNICLCDRHRKQKKLINAQNVLWQYILYFFGKQRKRINCLLAI